MTNQPQAAARRLNHYEDFVVGRRFRHHWGRTITLDDAVTFATGHLLYEPALFNRTYAKHLGLPDIVVSPFLVYATVLGLSVEDLSEAGGPFLGSDDVQFVEPVFPGDTLFAASEVLSRRVSRSQEGYGIVEWGTIARNQNAVKVLSFKRTSLVPFADPHAWQAAVA